MTTDSLAHRSSQPQSIPTFVTDHLALAAFLVSRGHVVTLVPTGSGKVLFGFVGGLMGAAGGAAIPMKGKKIYVAP